MTTTPSLLKAATPAQLAKAASILQGTHKWATIVAGVASVALTAIAAVSTQQKSS